MKKLTIGFVSQQFKKEKYELLSDEYVNSRIKLRYKCPKGHRRGISWMNWQQGYRCPYCAGHPSMDIDFVKSEFEKEGYKLLSTKYVNAHLKLDYICPKGHKYNITWNNWQQGYRCKYCGIEKASNEKRTNIDFVRSEFAKEGYVLLTTEYINNRQKLEYICSKGHKHNICWASWQQGHRCVYCSSVKAGEMKKLSFDFIKKSFEREGCVVLTKKYINARQKLRYICLNGHKHSMSWYNWKLGKRCPTCAIINNSGENHYNWKGGVACEPYCPIWLDKEFKQMILERDNYLCQNPDCWGTGSKLTGHHIDYDKKNCNPSNIITVCDSCNSRANKGRDYWTKFYREIMNKKYGYKYGENNEKKVISMPC